MRISKPSLYKILLYYSVFLSVILVVSGFYVARSAGEIISNILFLPVAIFLLMTAVRYEKEKSGKKLKSGSKRKK